LLGSFEPVLLGWTSREPLLGEDQARVTVEGLFRPFALVRGGAAAIWKLQAGKVVLEPFARLTRSEAAALDADAKDVVRFLGEN
jgi:DNA glycosylase AlkZ-like